MPLRYITKCPLLVHEDKLSLTELIVLSIDKDLQAYPNPLDSNLAPSYIPKNTCLKRRWPPDLI